MHYAWISQLNGETIIFLKVKQMQVWAVHNQIPEVVNYTQEDYGRSFKGYGASRIALTAAEHKESALDSRHSRISMAFHLRIYYSSQTPHRADEEGSPICIEK